MAYGGYVSQTSMAPKGKVIEIDISHLVEYIFKLVLCKRGAFHILHCAQILCHTLPILFTYWLHSLLSKLITNAGIIAEIRLGADDEARHSRAVMVYFRKPLLTNVLKRCRRSYAKADKEHICLGIR